MHKLLNLIENNNIREIEAEMGRMLSEQDLAGLSGLLADERTKVYFLILAEQLVKQFKLQERSIEPLIQMIQGFGYPSAALMNKFASLYALCGVFDWPLHFPQFMDSTVCLMARGDILGFNVMDKFLCYVQSGSEINEKRRKELKDAVCLSVGTFSHYLIQSNTDTPSEQAIAVLCVSIFEHLSTMVTFDPLIVLNAYPSFDLDGFIANVLSKRQEDAFYKFLESYLQGRPPNAKLIFALDRKSTSFLDYAVAGLSADEQSFIASLLYLKRRIDILFNISPETTTAEQQTAKMVRLCTILERMAMRYSDADNYVRNEIMLFFVEVSRKQFDASFLSVSGMPRELLVQILKNNTVNDNDVFVQAYMAYKRRDKQCFNHIEALSGDAEGERLMLKALDRIRLNETELRALIGNVRSNKLYVRIATMIPHFSILGMAWNVDVAEKYLYYLQFKEEEAMQSVPYFYEYFLKTSDYKFCFSILIRVRRALMVKAFVCNEEVIDSKIIEKCYSIIDSVPMHEMKYFVEFVGSLTLCRYFLEKLHLRIMKEWKESEEWADLNSATRSYLSILAINQLTAPMIELLQIDDVPLLRRILQILGKSTVPDEMRARCTYLLLSLYNSSSYVDIHPDVLNLLVDVYDANTLLMVNNDVQAVNDMQCDAKKRKLLMKAFLRNIKGPLLAEIGRRYHTVGAQGTAKKENGADVNLSDVL